MSSYRRGNNDLIPVSQVIALAKMRLGGIDTSDHDLWFEIEVNNALKKLSSASTIGWHHMMVELNNGMFRLPFGLLKLVAVKRHCSDNTTTDEEDTGAYNSWLIISRGYTNYFNGCGCLEDYIKVGDDGYGYLNVDLPEGDYDIYWIGYNVDENGVMKIYEDYESFLANYLCYKFFLVFGHKYFENPYIPRDQRTEFKKEYLAEKRKIKSIEGLAAFQEDRMQLDREMHRVFIANYESISTYA